MKAEFSPSDMWIYPMERIRYELHLGWLFIKSDISATIVPTLLFTIAAWNSGAGPWYDLAVALGCGLIYFCLYGLTFCLANQLIGTDEDRVNKPYRPLVAGLVSYRGTLMRWAVLMQIFTFVGWWLDLLEWTLLWQIAIVLHNFCGGSKHWFGKHLLMGVGIVAGLAPAWELVAPLTAAAWRWIIFFVCVILPLIATQDLRDIAGDRAIGRRTLPIVFGELPTRIILSGCFALLPIAVYMLLMAPCPKIGNALLSTGVLTTISLVIAARLLLYRTRPADHRTYTLFTYWYCCAMVSAILVL